MLWYYAENGVQKGPVTEDTLKKLADAGTVTPETLVWCEGMPDWQPYRVAFAPKPPPVPVPPSDTPGAGRADDAALDRAVAMAGAAGSGMGAAEAIPQRVYGGFWIRALAKILDTALLIFIDLLIQLPFVLVLMPQSLNAIEGDAIPPGMMGVLFLRLLCEIAVFAFYHGFFLSRYGATPGKMVLNLKVIRPDGGRISFARAVGRMFAEYLSGLILMVGYLMAAFDGEKRTLHDHLCDTRVIRE